MHTNNTNGKIYIGITARKPSVRFGSNGSGYEKCPRFWNAIQKYGWENFNHTIIAEELTKEEAENLEISLIKEYKSNNDKYGYNIGSGGDGSNNITDEGREKIRQSKLGAKNPNYGKKMTEKEKDRLRSLKPMLGKHHPDSARKKMSDAKKGKYTGEKHWRSKAVMCIETGEMYGGAREAANAVGVSHSCISDCCSGKQMTCKNMHWQYITTDENSLDDTISVSKCS